MAPKRPVVMSSAWGTIAGLTLSIMYIIGASDMPERPVGHGGRRQEAGGGGRR